MNPGTLVVILGHKRQQVTQTFSANASWTAPITTSSINTASGKGADGTPGTPGSYGPAPQEMVITHYYRRRDGGPDDVTSSTVPTSWTGPTPDGTSETTALPDSTVYYEETTITVYTYGDAPYYPGTAATTGASATAFGKTFPGGTGGAASTTTFSNIPITPGATYSIVVPSGGSITITYTQ